MASPHAHTGIDPPGITTADGVPDLTAPGGLAETLGLARGDVASVHVESTGASERTSLTFLEVAYAGAAAAGLPGRLVLKRTPPAVPGARPARAQEAGFYARLAASLPSPPVVRCLAARVPSPASPGWFLMEDLRATHAPAPDDEIDLGPAVDALARVHAARWEAGERFTWPRSNPTEESVRAAVHRLASHLPVFFDTAGDALTADGRKVYERVFASTLRPWLRMVDGRAQTLIHGDAHIGNFLFPREPGGSVYLVDWALWQADVGARDLAFLLLRWPPDRRRRMEEPLLRRYHGRLEALGVRGYGWDELWTDYRQCCVRNLTVPLMRQARGRSDRSWRELLDNAIAAFVELDGDALL